MFSLKSKLASVLASIAIFSCSPVPAAANPLVQQQQEFCKIATEYNLNWHQVLNQGATPAQVIKMHKDVLNHKGNNLGKTYTDVLEYMLYLSILNKDTTAEVAAEGLYKACTSALQQRQEKVEEPKQENKEGMI